MTKGFPSMLKSKAPKRFSFKPRYYDEIKDRVEEQEARVNREIALEKRISVDSEVRLREKIQEKWQVGVRAEANKKANKRVLMIVLFLAAIAYWYLK